MSGGEEGFRPVRSPAARAFADYAAEAWNRVVDGVDTVSGARPPGRDALRFGELAAQLWDAARDGQICLPRERLHPEALRLLDRWCATLGARAMEAPVLCEHGFVWLRRHAVLEQRVADRLRTLDADAPLGAVPDEADEAELDPAQRDAVRAALARRLLVLTGGPGTGKTFTVARLLRAMRRAAPGLRMAAAAPTGKAAARMNEQFAAHGVDGIVARTVDALLGRGAGVRARHDARDPLPVDVLVVDECSMLGLSAFARLLEALPDGARLVLVGDDAQLASVDAGAVFSQLARPGLLPGALVRLARDRRAGDAPHARFALAVREPGAGEDPLAVLATVSGEALRRLDPPVQADALLEAWTGWHALARAARETDDAALLAAAQGFRVLGAQKEGALGTGALNEAIGRRVQAALGVAPGARHWRGRVLMITRNDRAAGLANGDVGVCLDGWRAAFACATGLRVMPVSRLPPHEDGFAITVHKSQGSEYERVLLVPAREDSPLATRELLYTGATRAKRELWICATEGAIRQAVGRVTLRHGALDRRMRDA